MIWPRTATPASNQQCYIESPHGAGQCHAGDVLELVHGDGASLPEQGLERLAEVEDMVDDIVAQGFGIGKSGQADTSGFRLSLFSAFTFSVFRYFSFSVPSTSGILR